MICRRLDHEERVALGLGNERISRGHVSYADFDRVKWVNRVFKA